MKKADEYLPRYKVAGYSNFATITNSEELIEALSKPDNSRFYDMLATSLDDDGVYTIDLIEPELKYKDGKNTKLTHLKELLENGADIISTHAMFRNIIV